MRKNCINQLIGISLNNDMNLKLTICLVIIAVTSIKAQQIHLQIANGPILGKSGYTAGSNKPWSMFLGIPYAEQAKRFQLAKEKQPWTEEIDCTYDKPACVQGSPVKGSEDCLTLSVYTPNIQGSYPVLVWIHGGYFTKGNGSYAAQPPDNLVDEGIVFVQIQYRLGIFGFLSTEDLACTGNLGLKDQQLALQWVQKNIQYFGGDPTRVTLGGQSAGAVSASLHLLSPKSKGLFHAMITNSGSPLNLWALNRRARETAFGIGTALGIVTTNSTKLIEALKLKNYVDLQTASENVSTGVTLENPLAGIYYGYVPEVDNPDAFFTGKSEQQLSAGSFQNVPLLLGTTSDESILFGDLIGFMRLYFLQYEGIPSRLAPYDLTKDFLKLSLAGQAIKNQFFPTTTIISQDQQFLHFVSSDQFDRPIWKFGTHVSNYQSKTYYYEFAYKGPTGDDLATASDGVGHGADLNYLFFNYNLTSPADDKLTALRLARLWANFVKTQNPTPSSDSLLGNVQWLPMRSGTSSDLNYFNINATLTPSVNYKNEDMQFWNSPGSGIYPVYGEPPYDTY
ncbi:unnamed protein product [Phyllotreta striolata]|uniref:Carboxylic ester hydrolase n=1 Tax=Phyllotreta striolata TaxID=444603 RepID=A0A9N9THG8_PHYSR|nr:unnamed protein product [Phyllotreta striolata]